MLSYSLNPRQEILALFFHMNEEAILSEVK